MKSVDFLQANIGLAKDQPQYQTLFVYYNSVSQQGPMTMCFELDKQEIEAIVRTGKLYFTQITFNKGFQPINMSVLSPFPDDPEGIQPPMDENRTAAEIWDRTHFLVQEGEQEHRCQNCGNTYDEHFWSTRQCYL